MEEPHLSTVYIFHLEKAYKQFKKYKKNFLKNAGFQLTSDQWIILKLVSDAGTGINQRDLAAQGFKEPASVTRILDILENKNLVERCSTEDRRMHELYLTEEGKVFVDKVTPIAQEIRAQGVAGFSDAEVAELKRLLHKVYQNFQ